MSYLHNNAIPLRCELVSPSAHLIRKSARCSDKKFTTREDCRRNGKIWIREKPSHCNIQGGIRKISSNYRETVCPLCMDVIFDSENRWGCDCAHPICNKCFQNHVKKTGYKCPICKHFCDEDKICRNYAVHEEDILGEHQPIFCPICKQECSKCFSIQIRD